MDPIFELAKALLIEECFLLLKFHFQYFSSIISSFGVLSTLILFPIYSSSSLLVTKEFSSSFFDKVFFVFFVYYPVIYDNDSINVVVKAARNIPSVDVCNVERLNL